MAKRTKKEKFWKGISSAMAAVMAILIAATNALWVYSADVNSLLSVSTSKIVDSDGGDEDTIYYKSEFGDFTVDNFEKLADGCDEQTVTEANEGIVLLKNGDNALPLQDDERDVTLFGHASYNPFYAWGHEQLNSYPIDNLITYKDALVNKGFKINETLFEAYESDPAQRPADDRGKGGNATGTENPGSFYEQYEGIWAEAYNDVAIVMIARQGGESTDMAVDEIDDDGATHLSSLALHSNEKEMMDIVSAGDFEKVIVLINSPYAMELGWLDDYDVDAALWISNPGDQGFQSVPDILTGAINPSGATVDTWAADSLSSPAVVNCNGNTPQYANAEELNDSGIVTDGMGASIFDTPSSISYVNVQQENIYIGYKYYETRYADVIANQGGAESSVGSFASPGDTWSYSDEVCYPFGYGLSYTSFRQEITNVAFDEASDSYNVTVKVSNTGDVAGKKAVIIYAQTPYEEYEKTYLVEKPALQVVGYDKTDIIEPGSSAELAISVDRYYLASYDDNNAKGYMLSGGDYYFAVGDSSHDALNNILSAQGYEGLIDYDGSPFTENVYATIKVSDGLPADNAAPDTDTYAYSAATGAKVTNLFDYADYNYWEDDTGMTVEYLTRTNWAGTFPTEMASVVVKGEEMEKLLQGNWYEKADDAVSARTITQGVDNGITFAMMKDVDYEDDEMWDQYLDQFTLEEMADQIKATRGGNNACDKVGMPVTISGDGSNECFATWPATIGYGVQKVENPYADHRSQRYTSLLSATWDRDLQLRRGELMGEEMLFAGVNKASVGGGNLHRTPFCGRQSQYPSEDPNTTDMYLEIFLTGINSKGVRSGPKHFGGNDAEFNRLGTNIFATEQSLREGTFRGFEKALRADKVDCGYVMPCNHRIGLKWGAANEELYTDLLRGEWGFRGMTQTDCSMTEETGFTSASLEVLISGIDGMWGKSDDITGNRWIAQINDNDDGDVLLQLRNVVKNVHYVNSHSCAVNGLSTTSTVVSVVPTWQILTIAILIIVAMLTTASIARYAVIRNRNRKEDIENGR